MSSQREDWPEIEIILGEDPNLEFIYSSLTRNLDFIKKSISVIEKGISEQEADLEVVKEYIEANRQAMEFMRSGKTAISISEYKKVFLDIKAAEDRLKYGIKSAASLSEMLEQRQKDFKKADLALNDFLDSLKRGQVLAYEKRRK